MKKFVSILLVMILFGILNAQTPNIVISGVYGGGGNSGSIYKNDYIELYNTTSSAVDLAGYTLYYASATGTSATTNNTYTFPAGSTIGAKKFALIKCAAGTGTQPEWPVTFDFNASGAGGGNLQMSASDGKVLLLSAYHNLTATNSIPTTLAGVQAMTNYVDYVPFGTATPKFGADLTGLSASIAAKRKYNDATKVIDYTLSVGADFNKVTADANAPRNSSYGNENQVATPTFSPGGGTYSSPQTVTITCTTAGATIHYTTDGTTPTSTSTPYTTSIPVSITTTIKAIGVKAGMDNSNIATAVYNFPVIVDVPNIAAFKAANTPVSTDTYRITGNVTFVFSYKTTSGNHSNYYIKDATGGLVVFDNASATITKTYNEGDLISGGIMGKCNMYNGMFQFTPVSDFPAGTPGGPVAPIELTMANLLDNFATYESQLIRLENVTFAEGTFGTTSTTTNIAIYQNGKEMICRNHYSTITGFTPDTEASYNVVGFVIPYVKDAVNEKQLAPRKLADIEKIEGFIPVENITNVPTTAAVNKELALTGTVLPTNATNKNITWSVKDAGATNAVITGNKFKATAEGTAKIKATIINGIDEGVPFEKEFTITVSETVNTYIITASVNNASWGSIDPPAGDIEVIEGNSLTFTITPNTNYKINEVLVNGEKMGAIPTYTFDDVKEDGTIQVFFALDVGIEENALSNIHIYPNPTTGELRIESSKFKVQSVEFFDIYGKNLTPQTSHPTPQTSINISVFPAGIYFVKITTEQGTVIKKVVKQ